MRLGTKVGNDFWISMGPVGWCIYFFIWRPVWLVICIVIWILILIYKLIVWCGKSLWKLAYGHR
jgi:hypothetical protein